MSQKGNAVVVRGVNADGNFTVEYTKEGMPCVHLQLHTKHAVKLAAYQLITKELEFCAAAMRVCFELVDVRASGFIQFDLDDQKHIIMRSLYISAVITYGKVFSKVKTEGRSKLEALHVFDGHGAKYAPYHEWIMEDQRHKFVAHAGINEYEQTRTNLVLPADIANVLSWHIVMAHATFVPMPNPADLADFPRLIDFVAGHVEQVKQKQIDILLAEEAGLGLLKRHKIGQRISTIKAPKPAPAIPE